MTKEKLEQEVARFVEDSEWNYISEQEALSPEFAGLRIYDTPVWGYSDARDPMYRDMKKKEAVGPQFLLPEEWLPGTESVITFFLPFTDEVKKSNRLSDDRPSIQWLHARIEGQRFVMKVCDHIREILLAEGISSVIPAADARFKSVEAADPGREGVWQTASYTSNWSERHVAYISGLGTFGLSKGLITEKGMAGRLGSLVTNGTFAPRERAYTGLYDYCTNCGACIRRCPVSAISHEKGKEHAKCAWFVDMTKEKYHPYYGCGKCQTKVPCESGIPKGKND